MRKIVKEKQKRRDDRIEELVAYCKVKFGKDYTPDKFDLVYIGYEHCRRRQMSRKEL